MIRSVILVTGYFVFAALSDGPAMMVCAIGLLYLLASGNEQYKGYSPWQKIP